MSIDFIPATLRKGQLKTTHKRLYPTVCLHGTGGCESQSVCVPVPTPLPREYRWEVLNLAEMAK